MSLLAVPGLVLPGASLGRIPRVHRSAALVPSASRASSLGIFGGPDPRRASKPPTPLTVTRRALGGALGCADGKQRRGASLRAAAADEAEATGARTDQEAGSEAGVLRHELLVLSAVVVNGLYDAAAWGYEGYDGIGVPDDEATPLQNAFGLLFTAFCGWYFLRVVKKRGNRAKEFRVANTLPVSSVEPKREKPLALLS